MKNKIFFITIFLVFMISCRKEINQPENIPVKLSELTFSPNFKWNSTKEINFSIQANRSTIILITSEDGNKTLHKGFYKSGENEIYSLKINIPTYMDKLMVNNRLVDIDSNNIILNLDEESPKVKSIETVNEIVSYWPLDEGNGTLTNDAAGENNGNIINVSWGNGISGNALEFDGITGCVIVPEADNLDITQQLTLTAWVKSYENKEAKIAQKGDWDGYNLGIGKWKGWKASIMMDDMNNYSLEWDQGIPLMNEWYFVAMTYDGSDFKLYVNGALRSSMELSGTMHNNTRDFCIGSDNNAQKYFKGLIDEVGVYSSALTSEEIQNMYQVMPNSDSDGDGVPDFQDDYSNDPGRAFDNFWPSGQAGCIAFEDLWPGLGDFDFNDLVVDFQFQTVTNASNYIVEVFGDFKIKAIGASQRNGFGFQLNQDFGNENINVSGAVLTDGIINNNSNGTETGQNKTTIIVFDNSYSVLLSAGGTGVNVIPENTYVEPVTIRITMNFIDNMYLQEDIDIENFNPFLIVNRERGHEIHLPDYLPTNLMNDSYFGTSHDDSNPETGKYFKTTNNVPWVIILPETFDYPIEKNEITEAHLHFVDWAQSSGTLFLDWYQNKSGYRNTTIIY